MLEVPQACCSKGSLETSNTQFTLSHFVVTASLLACQGHYERLLVHDQHSCTKHCTASGSVQQPNEGVFAALLSCRAALGRLSHQKAAQGWRARSQYDSSKQAATLKWLAQECSQGHRPDRKQGVGILMPPYVWKGSILHGSWYAWPGMTADLEKTVVAAWRTHLSDNGDRLAIFCRVLGCILTRQGERKSSQMGSARCSPSAPSGPLPVTCRLHGVNMRCTHQRTLHRLHGILGELAAYLGCHHEADKRKHGEATVLDLLQLQLCKVTCGRGQMMLLLHLAHALIVGLCLHDCGFTWLRTCAHHLGQQVRRCRRGSPLRAWAGCSS